MQDLADDKDLSTAQFSGTIFFDFGIMLLKNFLNPSDSEYTYWHSIRYRTQSIAMRNGLSILNYKEEVEGFLDVLRVVFVGT